MTTNVIEIRQLTKDYGNNRGIFDVSLSVKKGEVFGFLGPNGAGKSTTIRHLMGFIQADQGSCQINGLDCLRDHARIQQALGYLPGEIAFMDDMTGLEFIKFMAKMKGMTDLTKAYELMERFELNPQGKIKKMSKGMKQKIGIICAFMHDPELLILDEPTSGLDPVSRDELLEIIEKYVEDGKHSVLFSTHITSDLEKVADYITYINYGELIYSGEKKKLLEEFYVIRNVREEIPIGIREKLIGVRKTKDGVQALLKKEYIKEISGLGRIEKATLDDIVVFTSKGE